ncbi:MAG: helix-hairpin-helix domain-containing protein [bacterium]
MPLALLALILSIFGESFADVRSLEISSEDDALEALLRGEIDRGEYEEILDLLRNPIDINSATKADLSRLIWLDETDMDNILAYREEHGGFGNKEHLKMVPGMARKYHIIAPFVEVRAWEAPAGSYRIRARDVEPDGKTPGLYNLLKMNVGGFYSVGGLVDRDIGEANYFDNVKFYVGVEDLPLAGEDVVVEAAFLGNYRAKFGSGLNINTLGRAAEPALRGDTTLREAFTLRGAAAQMRIHGLLPAAIYSDNLLDAEFVGDDRLDYGDKHDSAAKDNLREIILGGDLSYTLSGFNFGITAYRAEYSLSPHPTDAWRDNPWARNALGPNPPMRVPEGLKGLAWEHYVIGGHFAIPVFIAELSGEASYSHRPPVEKLGAGPSEDWAYLISAEAKIGGESLLVARYWDYGRYYNNVYADAPRFPGIGAEDEVFEEGKVGNQQGVEGTIIYGLGRDIDLRWDAKIAEEHSTGVDFARNDFRAKYNVTDEIRIRGRTGYSIKDIIYRQREQFDFGVGADFTVEKFDPLSFDYANARVRYGDGGKIKNINDYAVGAHFLLSEGLSLSGRIGFRHREEASFAGEESGEAEGETDLPPGKGVRRYISLELRDELIRGSFALEIVYKNKADLYEDGWRNTAHEFAGGATWWF